MIGKKFVSRRGNGIVEERKDCKIFVRLSNCVNRLFYDDCDVCTVGEVVYEVKYLIQSMDQLLCEFRFLEANEFYEQYLISSKSREWYKEKVSKYEELRRSYLDNEFERLLSVYKFEEARQYYNDNLSVNHDIQWYQNQEQFYVQEYICKTRSEILNSLDDNDYESANNLYDTILRKYDTSEWYQEHIRDYNKKRLEKAKTKVILLLSSFMFREARKYYNKHCLTIENCGEWYNEQFNIYKEKEKQGHMQDIEQYLSQFQFEEARKYYDERLRNRACEQWYENVVARYRKKYIEQMKSKIEKALICYDFVQAENFYNELKKYDEGNWYVEEIKKCKEIACKELEKNVTDLLKKFCFDSAWKIFEEQKSNESFVRWYKSQFEYYSDVYKKITDLLCKFEFSKADDFGKEFNNDRYEQLKGAYVKSWFEKCVIGDDGKPYLLDEQQTLAVLNANKNTIVAARAGSGKTRTLVAKIIYLVAKYGVEPKEFLVFVFNKKASNEINARLKKIKVNGKPLFANCKIASTFHSFAWKIVFDICKEREKFGSVLSDRNKSLFIQAILRNNDRANIYDFFRKEVGTVNRVGSFDCAEDFYYFLRNQKHETLDGKFVKSETEKIICDYLFEHGVKYYYETELYPNSLSKFCSEADAEKLKKSCCGSIKPDFCLAGTLDGTVRYDIPWEHWAIRGDETEEEICRINDGGYIGEYAVYKDRMLWKQWFYSQNWSEKAPKASSKSAQNIKRLAPLIETYREAGQSRVEFENYIDRVLTDRGIVHNLLSREELISAVWENQIVRLTSMVEQFINRAQQLYFDDQDGLECEIKHGQFDLRTKAFLDIAYSCYRVYYDYLLGIKSRNELETKIVNDGQFVTIKFDGYGFDFNILMARAIEILKTKIPDDLYEYLQGTKYIFVDEYQDFSRLFYELLCNVRLMCPKSKLFVVGDDWQAINRFAGSDTEFYKKFTEYFGEDTRQLEIFTNYRSSRNVVEYARQFVHMHIDREGKVGVFREELGAAGVITVDKENDFVDYETDKDLHFREAMRISTEEEPSKKSVIYLKRVVAIVRKCWNAKKIYLLHRNRDTSFYRIDLQGFLNRVKKFMCEEYHISSEVFDEKVEIMTMHKSKGLEADVVIILEADEDIIPMNHPDTELYEIFGESMKTSWEDQVKLFYVAMTRAKDKLYIMHDKVEDGFYDGFLMGMPKILR